MIIKEKAIAFANAYANVPYKFENGPVAEVDWFTEGLNCQLFIHLAHREFFTITLPRDLRSSELFADQDFFIENSLQTASEGDLVFMGPKMLKPISDHDNEDAKKLHLAMIANVNGSIDIIHARPKVGVVVEPIADVMEIQRGKRRKRPYEKIFAVKGLNF